MIRALLALTGAAIGTTVPASYPNCTEANFSIRNATLAHVNVADFVDDGAVGENCSSDCTSSHVFRVRSADSCSLICSKSSTCDWWTADQTFANYLNTTTCYLYSTGGTSAAVSGVRIGNSTSGHKGCSPSVWPSCVQRDSFVSARGYTQLWIDAVTRLQMDESDPSCHNQNCPVTDRFRIESVEHCATVCTRMPRCEFWSVAIDGGIQTCWLRKSSFKTEVVQGAISGSRECAMSAPFRLPGSWTRR